MLGGGLIKDSTNLVIEESNCIGDIFLTSLLRNRIKAGDIGLVDCFFSSPKQLKERCKAYGVDLERYGTKIHYLDFSSRKSVKKVLGFDSIDTFAEEYVKVIANLVPQGEIFNIDLSLSASAERYGEEQIYRHLMRKKGEYVSCKRAAIYLLEREAHPEEFTNRLIKLFDAVINLSSITHNHRVDRFLSVEKSPLPNFSREKVGYKIISDSGKIVFGDNLGVQR